jgi:hypothetical protein
VEFIHFIPFIRSLIRLLFPSTLYNAETWPEATTLEAHDAQKSKWKSSDAAGIYAAVCAFWSCVSLSGEMINMMLKAFL